MIVGDIAKAFLDKAFIRHPPRGCRKASLGGPCGPINNMNDGGLIVNSNYDNYATIPQAIETLKSNTYAGIAVVMSGLQTKLIPAIKSLSDFLSTLSAKAFLTSANLH